MIKKYNIFVISRLYLRNYYRFVVDNTNIQKSSDALILFKYSIKKLYKLDTIEYSSVIDRYGEECIAFLKDTPDTPQVISKMSYEDRVRIVNVCEGYAVATNILTHRSIVNNRLKEG